MPTSAPSLDVDPFADEFILNPWERYREMRDAAPVIQLAQYGVHGVARFEDVKTTMKDRERFQSSRGPGFNGPYNERMKATVVAAEPPEHTEIRSNMVKRLRLARLRDMQPVADRLAEQLTLQFLEQGSFDAAADLARPFVSAFVGEVLGITHDLAELAIDGSTQGFNSTGPLNDRTRAAAPVIEELFTTMGQLTQGDFTEGSIGWDIFGAHDRGEMAFASSLSLIFNFLGPAFDTTISAMAYCLWLLATNPDQWELLKATPSLAQSTINETLRFESPLQNWSRWCEDGADLGGYEIPPQTRVAVFPGSGNRDERHYENPDRFDITRNPVDHLGFGQGIHMCVGAPLARMELTSVLAAFTAKVNALSPDGEPTLRINNTTRGYSSAPISIA